MSMFLAHIDTGGFDIYGVGATEDGARATAYLKWVDSFVTDRQPWPLGHETAVEEYNGRTDLDAVVDYYGITVLPLVDGAAIR